jgi:tetratricopeptide (TPR) repeat protein
MIKMINMVKWYNINMTIAITVSVLSSLSLVLHSNAQFNADITVSCATPGDDCMDDDGNFGVCVQQNSNFNLLCKRTTSLIDDSSKPNYKKSRSERSASLSLRERSYNAFQSGDETSARVLFLQAYQSDSRSFTPSDLYNLASLFHDVNSTLAIQFYTKALKSGFSKQHYVLHNLGEIYESQRSFKQAKRYYNQALAIVNSLTTREALARLKSIEMETPAEPGATPATPSLQVMFAREMLDKAGLMMDNDDRIHHILSATKVLMYNNQTNQTFRHDASPEDLRTLATLLMSIPSSSVEKYTTLAKLAYLEAENRAVKSRDATFYATLKKHQRINRQEGIYPDGVIDVDHKLWLLHEMITEEESLQIIQLFGDSMNKSIISLQHRIEYNNKHQNSELKNNPNVRTSETAFVPKSMVREHSVFQSIIKRLSNIVDVDFSDSLKLEVQVVRYTGVDQYFLLHHDAGPLYPRLFSVFVYLNTLDVKGGGGETCFPNLSYKNNAIKSRYVRGGSCSGNDGESGICVHPFLGNALLFYNLDEAGSIDLKLQHEACVLKQSNLQKWGMNIWFSI